MKVFVDLFWGYHVLGLILLTGIRLSFSTGFFQIKSFFKWIKYSLCSDCKEKGISPFSALSAALAGSIGTGNIVGVAAAISVGGAGAIFWMWISALFGMMTVFAEVSLSAKYKNDHAKGAFAYIEKIGKGKILPFIYGLGCVLSSLTMGNMAQSNAVATGLSEFGVPKILTGVLLAIFLFVLTGKGIKGVCKITEKLVPIMTIFFFIISTLCLFKFSGNIIPAFREIIDGAFNFRAVGGAGIYLAIKTGVSRGVFTNEAGLGSSSMAFCEVEEKSPVKLGYLGIFQVFADTIVMCLITAMCVLCGTSERTGEYLVLTAFENALGSFGRYSVSICMVLFALATVTTTCYYGKVGLNYISKSKLDFLFPLMFAVAALFGCLMNMSNIFELCDGFNGLMAIPNILALSYFSPQVTKMVREYKLKSKK